MLSDFNHERIAQIDWQPPREFWITAKSGKKIQSLIVLPPAFDPAKKYPLVVFPHGGPHNMIKDQFFVRWNYHLLTSPGYVMLMPNYTARRGMERSSPRRSTKTFCGRPRPRSSRRPTRRSGSSRTSMALGRRRSGQATRRILMAWFEGDRSVQVSGRIMRV